MLRLGTVVLGVDQVERAVAFWSNALGYDVVPLPESDDDFTVVRDRQADRSRSYTRPMGLPRRPRLRGVG
jgi:hypothetical protein